MEHDNVIQSRKEVVIFINDRLKKMTPFVPECSIHRVPKRLLNMNTNAYGPKEISIGPYHHDEKKFKTTQELKLHFFKSYQSRVCHLTLENIVEMAQGWEKEARKYYSEPIGMNSKEFVKMMVLDGCFIVEFMITKCVHIFPEIKNKVHSSFYKAMSLDIGRDLIMLENQLPFFVLQHLFDLVYYRSLIKEPFHEYDNVELFKKVVQNFLINRVFPIKKGIIEKMFIIHEPCHLLDFLTFYFDTQKMLNMIHNEKPRQFWFHSSNRWSNIPKEKENVDEESEWLPPTATELTEAGIVLKKVKGDEVRFMDISFKNGILNIPPLLIDDRFETYARNLLAFSQFNGEENDKNNHRENAIHYFRFLDELITTEQDVNLLVNKGIILNQIGGSDREISKLFNSLGRNIIQPPVNCFSNISKDLRQHCGRRWNRWMAILRTNYFNTPWTWISFLAAAILIVLTVLQTVFTGISTF